MARDFAYHFTHRPTGHSPLINFLGAPVEDVVPGGLRIRIHICTLVETGKEFARQIRPVLMRKRQYLRRFIRSDAHRD